MPVVSVQITQSGESASVATIRTHQVMVDRPLPKGGTDQGGMGGELFLAGLGGCFMSNLLAAIKARDIDANDMQVVVEGNLEDGPPRFTAATLKVSGDYPDREEMQKLLLIAERGCIVANTVRKALDLTIQLA